MVRKLRRETPRVWSRWRPKLQVHEGRKRLLESECENGRVIDFHLRHGFKKIGAAHFVIAGHAYENYVLEAGLRYGPMLEHE